MKNDVKSKMISIIKKNRISSVEVADALNKSGVIEGPTALVKGKFVVGEVQYIYGHSETNWPIHEQGEKIKEGGILYVDTFNCNNKAAFGDVVAKYFILYKGIEGVVVNGLLRDVHTLVKESYPLWCKGITPLGCYNKNIEASKDILKEASTRKKYFEGGIMVCDDSGCTFIHKELITDETLRKLEFIELQEDIWYYCIDTLKWSTYKSICQKAYLMERDVLPQTLKDKLEEFNL
jgi:4-hydroxy-4-methyl-2-oxoglutarate aldolase